MIRLIVVLFCVQFAFAQKPQLYYFSGSDWCIPCIEFQKKIDSDTSFRNFLNTEFNFQSLDFPQRTKGIPKKELSRRDSLAQLYNPKGTFPFLVVVENQKAVFSILPGNQPTNKVRIVLAQYLKNTTPKVKSERRLLMGNTFVLTLCSNVPDSVLKNSWQLLESIENQLSSWKEDSEIGQINKYAGIKSVSVSWSTLQLIKRSITLSKGTQGAFDITIKPATKIWSYKTQKIPSDKAIDSVLQFIGSDKIIFSETDTSVFLPQKGMQIDLGGIGKGYAAMMLKNYWESIGIDQGVINASGDLFFVGEKCDGGQWDVLVKSPFDESIILKTTAKNESVVTSGDYEKFFTINQQRYGHILNPKTCRPSQSDLTSVTIFAKSAELADALATACMVLGVGEARSLIEKMRGVEAIFIKKDQSIVMTSGLTEH